MTQPAYKLSIILLGQLPGKVNPLDKCPRGQTPGFRKKRREKRVLVVVLIISFNCVLFGWASVSFFLC